MGAIVAAGLSAAAALVPGTPAWGAGSPSTATTKIVVQELPGAGSGPERAVTRLGGRVTRQLPIIDGFAAEIPAAAAGALRTVRGVRHVSHDVAMRLHSDSNPYKPSDDRGSMYKSNEVIKASDAQSKSIVGNGVDVAVIDSGVARVRGLDGAGKVVDGPDLSVDAADPSVRGVDRFGHGTHMAGIIAAADGVRYDDGSTRKASFFGVAPGARIVNVKVADRDGNTDASLVIAAIDWVVQHRNRDGFNIRVLNLSLGTQSGQAYTIDPLAHAAEVAWRKGIVVVAAAGNDGTSTGRLNNPAYDPFVIAVGADDTKGSGSTDDDEVPAFSSRGDGVRNPDLVAPGKSIQSLRVPGGYVDREFAGGRLDDRFFRGSGTSQAAAVVSGAAAVLVGHRPELTPDQVKALLVATAKPLKQAEPAAQGAGLLMLWDAVKAATPLGAVQSFPPSSGTGSIAKAYENVRLGDPVGTLGAEVGLVEQTFDSVSHARAAENETTWSGMRWDGMTWTGMRWDGMTWRGMTWTGMRWNGMRWNDSVWAGTRWD